MWYFPHSRHQADWLLLPYQSGFCITGYCLLFSLSPFSLFFILISILPSLISSSLPPFYAVVSHFISCTLKEVKKRFWWLRKIKCHSQEKLILSQSNGFCLKLVLSYKLLGLVYTLKEICLLEGTGGKLSCLSLNMRLSRQPYPYAPTSWSLCLTAGVPISTRKQLVKQQLYSVFSSYN